MSRAVVLCGHSHRQNLAQMPGGPLILNSGSVGCPVFADGPRASRTEPSLTARTLCHPDPTWPRWSAEFFALDYDWDQAAVCARQNGFADWAEALVTGSVT
jgi:hypothetical protein